MNHRALAGEELILTGLKGFKNYQQSKYRLSLMQIFLRSRDLTATFWNSYNAAETTTGLRACLLWAAKSGRLVPCKFQLQATISLMRWNCLREDYVQYSHVYSCINIYGYFLIQILQVREFDLTTFAGFAFGS